MTYHKINIMGELWKYSLATHKYLEELGEEEIAGITFPETKTMLFHEDELSLEVILHELVHAFYEYTYIETANLNPDQLEEFWAEFICKNYFKLGKVAREMYNNLKKD